MLEDEAEKILELIGAYERVLERTAESEIGGVVPLHGELAIGALQGILCQAGVTPKEFSEALSGLVLK